jgi:hypothetical protein
MGIQAVLSLISSLGTIVAALALFMTYVQFRRLDRSIKGNTYQMLSDQAIDLLKLPLQYPQLGYLRLADAGEDDRSRQQAVFDRLWANYLDNVWGQMQLGLMSSDLYATYMSLIEQLVVQHPGIAEQMTSPNFTESLRLHVAAIAQVHQQARASEAIPEQPLSG